MECKILCFYNNKDHEEILKTIYDSLSFEIFADDREIENYLKKKGKKVTGLDEYFSDYSENIFDIYHNAKKTIQKYEDACNKIKYDGVKVTEGLGHYLMEDVILLEKAKRILDKKSNTVFIFKKFSFAFFSILEHASKMGYNPNDKMGVFTIKNGIGKTITPDTEYRSIEKVDAITKYKNSFSTYLNNVAQDNTQNKSLSQIKASIKLFPIASQIISSKLKISKIKSMKDIMKKIEHKISNLQESDYGFFLSSNRDDALEPYNILIDKMDSGEKISIFTIDPITSSFLTKRNLRHLDFFEETYVVANALKNSEGGRRTNDEIIDASKKNHLTLLHCKSFNQKVIDGIYRTIATKLVMDALLAKINLKKCVIMNGPMLSKVISNLARKHSIPSLSIESVLVDNNALSSIAYDADRICIYGNQGKKALSDLGLENNRIFVTGNPKYDYIKNADLDSKRKSLCSSLDFDVKMKVILVAMSRWRKNDKIWISRLIKFSNKNRYQVIIKLHSRYKINPDTIESEIGFVKDDCKGSDFRILYEADMNELVSGTDLLVSDFSNVAIEAILLDKPVINVNFQNEELTGLQNFHEFGAALYTKNYELLERMIEEALGTDKFEMERSNGKKRIIELFNYQNDGKATDRILEVLQK